MDRQRKPAGVSPAAIAVVSGSGATALAETLASNESETAGTTQHVKRTNLSCAMPRNIRRHPGREDHDLARHIVEQKSGHFEPERFEDHYEATLAELLASLKARVKS
jgi:hypothetical protein